MTDWRTTRRAKLHGLNPNCTYCQTPTVLPDPTAPGSNQPANMACLVYPKIRVIEPRKQGEKSNSILACRACTDKLSSEQVNALPLELQHELSGSKPATEADLRAALKRLEARLIEKKAEFQKDLWTWNRLCNLKRQIRKNENAQRYIRRVLDDPTPQKAS